jgi:aryl-alcohol dehydrogenase-like predicted oxidoreductase
MLGTAQWGTPYGVTNTAGRLPDDTVADIVATAREWDISDVDTASGYGDAQERLRPFAREFSITTKVAGAGDVEAQIRACLTDLGADRIHGVLLHDWDALDPDSRTSAVTSLGRARDAGLVTGVGVSVYDKGGVQGAVDAFASRSCPLGIVQVPANVLDRRLDESPLLRDLAAQGAEIVVRSAFLQGVLLSSEGRLSSHPDVWRFRADTESAGRTPLEACLSHVRALPWATHVVIGVTSSVELNAACEAWTSAPARLADASLGSEDLDLLDPRRW